MSRKSNDWAWSQNLSPTLKLTLLSLADRTNEVHECFPSYKRLVNDTNLNIKTIQKNIKLLLNMGFIEDTGKRKGSTQQVKVLKFTFIDTKKAKQLNIGSLSKQPNKGHVSEGKPPNSGCLKLPKNGCPKATQNRATELPITEPPIEPKNINKRNLFSQPTIDDINQFLESLNKPNAIDARRFINHYESTAVNGDWYVGKRRMTNWKPSVQTWIDNKKIFGSQSKPVEQPFEQNQYETSEGML